MKHANEIFRHTELGGPDGTCWEWQRALNTNGYGVTMIGKERWLVHRLSYKLTRPDEDIGDKVICHKCDNPRCCNPEHLFSGTQMDNMRDCKEKGRRRKKRK